MRDGEVLRADRWHPSALTAAPTVLVRSPYGRRGPWGLLYGQPLARAGYNVVIASCRGTTTAGDLFREPMVREADDGHDTVAWLRSQPWFDGRLATTGLSYLGYTQWSLATDPPPELAAMAVQVGPHEFAQVNWPGGVFALADTLGWAQLVSGPQRQSAWANITGGLRRRRQLASALRPDRPPALLDAAPDATGGARVEWWEQWVTHGPDDPWWSALDRSAALERIDVPVLLQGGWHDLFRRASVEQYRALKARGVPVALTMGPWTHAGIARAWPDLIAEVAAWLDAVFARPAPASVVSRPAPASAVSGPALASVVSGPASPRRRPAVAGQARVAVLGTRRWDIHDQWPPAGSQARRWRLVAPGGLVEDDADLGGQAQASVSQDASASDPIASGTAFVYDPADPTPSVGGALLGPGAGAVDNRALEQRADVTVWDSEPLAAGLDIAGVVAASVWHAADGPHDLFVRLCDVAPDGRSTNVCDGISTVTSGEPGCSEIDLGPIAAHFGAGHRLRVQISAGAHPRFARNPGTGEPVATAALLRPVTITLHHDAARPSSLTLPVLAGRR